MQESSANWRRSQAEWPGIADDPAQNGVPKEMLSMVCNEVF